MSTITCKSIPTLGVVSARARELKAAERRVVRVRRSPWHRVITASCAPRDNNTTWDSISIITRKENGPVSEASGWLADGARAFGRPFLIYASVSLSLSNGTGYDLNDSASRKSDAAPYACLHTGYYGIFYFSRRFTSFTSLSHCELWSGLLHIYCSLTYVSYLYFYCFVLVSFFSQKVSVLCRLLAFLPLKSNIWEK